MDHTCPTHLDPASVFADLATFAFAEGALNILPKSRTNLGVVFVPKTNFDIIAPQKLEPFGDRVFEMLNGNPFINHKSLILVEETGIGAAVGLVSIAFAWSYHAHGWLVVGEDPSLD